VSRVVLVVDDDSPVARLVGAVLARDGLQAELAADGGSALERLQRGGIALVLTDMTMPGMSGLELARRAEERGLRAPFLVMSAFLDRETEGLLLAEPRIRGLLRKPFEIARLLAAVRAVLDAADDDGPGAMAATAAPVPAQQVPAQQVPGLALAPLWHFQRWPRSPASRTAERIDRAGAVTVAPALAAAHARVAVGTPRAPC